MKVLMLGWEFPPFITGGLGTACYGLTNSLSKIVDHIHFVLPRSFSNIEDKKNLNNKTKKIEKSNVDFFWADGNIAPYNSNFKLSHQSKNIFYNYNTNLIDQVHKYTESVKNIVHLLDFDIIHAHDWMTFIAGLQIKKITKKPMIAHIHATEYDRSGEFVNNWIYDIELKGLKSADLIIAVSNMTKKKIKEKYNITDIDKIKVVYNGILKTKIDKKQLLPRHMKEKIVVFLGRVTMQKGPNYFLKAASKILKERDDIRFVMAGDGDMLKEMIVSCAELNISNKFHFTGFLNDIKKESIFAMSDLFVMPSVSEPFGLTCLEAMLYDLPIIISKQSGVTELLKSVYKIDFWDIDKLAQKIKFILDNPVSKYKNNYINDLKNISWDKSANEILNIYKKLVI